MPLTRIAWPELGDDPPPDYSFPDRPAAWAFLRHVLHLIFSLFGSPERLMSFGGVSLCFRQEMHDWLGPSERLARILLLAEAATLTLPKPRRRWPVRRGGGRFPRQDMRAARSEDWRVRFTLLRGSTKSGSGAKGYSIPCISPVRLAARFEALARVAIDPASYARRLALALRRRADRAKMIAAILKPPPIKAGSLLRACAWALPLAVVSPLVFGSG